MRFFLPHPWFLRTWCRWCPWIRPWRWRTLRCWIRRLKWWQKTNSPSLMHDRKMIGDIIFVNGNKRTYGKVPRQTPARYRHPRPWIWRSWIPKCVRSWRSPRESWACIPSVNQWPLQKSEATQPYTHTDKYNISINQSTNQMTNTLIGQITNQSINQSIEN